MLHYAKARGVKRVVGHVLRENHKMLELAKRLGFEREGGRSGEPDIRVVKPTARHCNFCFVGRSELRQNKGGRPRR